MNLAVAHGEGNRCHYLDELVGQSMDETESQAGIGNKVCSIESLLCWRKSLTMKTTQTGVLSTNSAVAGPLEVTCAGRQ